MEHCWNNRFVQSTIFPTSYHKACQIWSIWQLERVYSSNKGEGHANELSHASERFEIKNGRTAGEKQD